LRLRPSKRRPLSAVLGLAIAGLALLPAAPAGAAFSLKDLSSAPDDPRAGAHSDFRIHIGFEDPGQDLKDLTISLPPGVSGDATQPETCTVPQFQSDSCPGNSLIGEVEAETTVVLVPPIGVPSTASGSIFNLNPQPGEPARFGVQLRPVLGTEVGTIHNQISVQLRPTDFGLDSILRDVPNTAQGIPIDINAMSIRLFGQANGGPFMGNPTSCSEAITRFSATSYGEPGVAATGQASFTPTECESLPFSPKLSATLGAPGQTKTGQKPPLTTVIEQSLGEANMRRAAVALPRELGTDGAALNRGCPAEQFAAGTCPESSQIGTAKARSPFLPEPLTGPVILIAATATSGLPEVGLDLHGPLSLRLKGQLAPLPAGAGAIFDGLPDIPIASFQLSFLGGSKGLLVSQRDLCKPPKPTLNGDFAAHSGAQRTTVVQGTVEGCSGGGPAASVKLKRATSERPQLAVDVDAGDDPLRKATIKLPSQLRFAGGRAWKRGADADQAGKGSPALGHTKRRATIRSRAQGGTEELALDVRRGALRAAKEIKPGKRLAFKIGVRDADGDATSLTKRVRVRR
jgi:hypothetical protein